MIITAVACVDTVTDVLVMMVDMPFRLDYIYSALDFVLVFVPPSAVIQSS